MEKIGSLTGPPFIQLYPKTKRKNMKKNMQEPKKPMKRKRSDSKTKCLICLKSLFPDS